jgi:Popeye protein conserved region
VPGLVASEKVVEAFMYEFVADQVLGIGGLINLSNIVFLVAYSVRDVLKRRILAIVGEALTLPYYYLQNELLWPPIFWAVAFMILNSVRVVATILERRPIVLSDKEEQLYRVAFSPIDKREFLRLVRLARWVDCSPGGDHFQEGPADVRGCRPDRWGPRSHSRWQHQTGDSTWSAHSGRERL